MTSGKDRLRALLPPIVVAWRRRLLDGLARRRRPERVRQLERDHQTRNQGLAADEICIREGITLRIHPECRPALDYFCFYSPSMVDEMDAFLDRATGKLRLLDIGARDGVFALVFTKSAKERAALAVDASPYALPHLLYNVFKNPDCRVTPVECALTDKPGVLPMALEGQHAVAASLVVGNQPTMLIEAKTGDALCADLNFAPDVVKIDVEGHEVKVLRGLTSVLARCQPLIFLEYHPARVRREGDRPQDVVDLLQTHRYTASLLDGSPYDLSSLPNCVEDFRLVLTTH